MGYEKKNDWELVQACRRDDSLAWQTLIGRYERLVLAIPLRYGIARTDAEDVAQLTFTNLMKSLRSFHAASNIKSWLITVARRNSWRVLERYDREQVYGESDLTESALALGMATEDKTTDLHVIDWLHTGLKSLNERCQTLLHLLFFEPNNLSYDDISTQLGVPKNSMGAIRSRCLKSLRRWMEKMGSFATKAK